MPCYSRVTIAAQDAVKNDVEVKADTSTRADVTVKAE